MEIRNTFSNSGLTPPTATNSESANNEKSGIFSSCRSVRLTEDPIQATPTGYVKGKVPVKTIEKKLHFHQVTPLDLKQRGSKASIFDQLIPYLMSETGMTQTSVLTKLLATLEFTPYLRKISSGKMREISTNPQLLQAELLSELTTRIKQGYKLNELCRLAGEPGSGNITVDKQHQTISIGHNQFTREELGDETYRELRDRLSQSHSGKKHSKDPNAILASLQTRKNLAMAHWQELVLTVLNIQDASVKHSIASALGRGPEQVLSSPFAQKEWEALITLMPKLKLITHSGFLLMPILYPWLSAHHTEGDKLSSRHLAWLKSMVTHRLYTQLPPLEETGLNKLCIYKELLLSSEKTANSGVLAAVKDAINDAQPQQLKDITDLFAPLLCDLSPSLPAEHRLGIIYTLLKFRDQSLLGKLLHIPSIGRDALLAMYKTQLILTYNLDDQADASLRAENEVNVNCLIKTLLVRMALSIILMASKEGVSISPEIMDKAQTLIDHHNEGLRIVLSPEELGQQGKGCDDEDMDSVDSYNNSDNDTQANNSSVSATDYLTIPEHLLADGQTVALDPQHLILPQDKHFRNSSPKQSSDASDRREPRIERDEKQLRKDFLLTPRAADLTKPIDWIKMDVPISFLFTGSISDSGLSETWQTFSNELLPLIRQAVINNPLDEPQTLNIIRDLFSLAGTTGKPGIHLNKMIAHIQEKMPDSRLSSVLEQLAIMLPKQSGNQERRILLELAAFQLFAELNPSEQQFRHLMKLLYIIQSRSHHLRFGDDVFGKGQNSDSNLLKLKLGKLFRSEWREPDDLLGYRIRRAVKSAIKSSTRGCDYQQVMNALLESMRPSDHASDTYPNLVHEKCLEVEEIMKQRWEIDTDLQKLLTLGGHNQPTYQANLRGEIITLIQSAIELSQQFLPEDSNDSGAPMSEDTAHQSSDQANFDMISESVASSSDSHLYEQLKRLIPLIGNWLNEVRDDGLISEEDAFHAGIDKLVQFSNSLIEVSQKPHQLNEDEVLQKIIKLNDKFCHLQKWRIQWQSSHNIASTHNQWLSTQITLQELRGEDLPSPDDLQEQINNIVFGAEIPVFSPADQDMLNTVSALQLTTPLPIVKKALDHQDIMIFNHGPEQLTHRLTEMKSVWDDIYRAKVAKHHSLTRTLYHLKTRSSYNAVVSLQDVMLAGVRNRHKRIMNDLQITQTHCDAHPVRQLSYSGDPTLLSTLESMKMSHEAKSAGIDTAPLSRQQEQQLRVTLDHKPDTSMLSDETSLFDLIGLEQSRQERLQHRAKRRAERLEIETKLPGKKDPKHKTYFETHLKKDLPDYQRKNTQDYNRQIKEIEVIQTNMNELAANHSEKVRQLEQYNKELDTLLGTRKDSQILIDGQEYSYADAFIGLKHKDDYYHVHLSRSQQYAGRTIHLAIWQQDMKKLVHQKESSWLQLARDCHSRGVSPQILPQVVELMELEDLAKNGWVTGQIIDLQRQIRSVKRTIHENSTLIEAEVKRLETSLKPELEAQAQKTRDAQQTLFSAAFEHGHQLSGVRAMQRLLCQYLHEGKEAASIKADIIRDCEALEKHIPTTGDCIEPPPQNDGRNDRLSTSNLVFQIINVPGAFPLLQSFHEQGHLAPWQMLSIDAGGKPSSALIFSAAKGRYMACETLIKALNGTQLPYSIDFLNLLLTVNPSDDNRNLLHHIAVLAKPETLGALLQLLNDVSKKQDFDPDYPTDTLKNRVALDREYFLKSLLTQEDYEGLHPTDLLLFNIGKKIREWPEGGEQALTSFCNDFLINDAKNMWIVAAESFSTNQLVTSIKCFMKGISDLEQLSRAKREAAETLLKNLMRIFKVHGPDGLHEDLMAQIKPEVEAMEISDIHSHGQPRRS